jgi:NAD(P)-dependent dehydrogenase (short-subunit alcohol dehydrogenase family)
MTHIRNLTIIVASVLLSACASPTVDTSAPTFDETKYAVDLDNCRGGTALDAALQGLGGVAVGSALGLVTGASIPVFIGGSLESVIVGVVAWREGWKLKVFGYINLSRLVYARMKARGSGVIVNDIGNAGERLDADYNAGTSGNAALMAFTRALGGQSLDHGIRVVGVNPGPVETDRIVKLMKTRAKDWYGDEDRYKELMSRFPMGRAATVAEVADLILFLASDRASYISGAIVTIDGGITSRNSIV